MRCKVNQKPNAKFLHQDKYLVSFQHRHIHSPSVHGMKIDQQKTVTINRTSRNFQLAKEVQQSRERQIQMVASLYQFIHYTIQLGLPRYIRATTDGFVI